MVLEGKWTCMQSIQHVSSLKHAQEREELANAGLTLSVRQSEGQTVQTAKRTCRT